MRRFAKKAFSSDAICRSSRGQSTESDCVRRQEQRDWIGFDSAGGLSTAYCEIGRRV